MTMLTGQLKATADDKAWLSVRESSVRQVAPITIQSHCGELCLVLAADAGFSQRPGHFQAHGRFGDTIARCLHHSHGLSMSHVLSTSYGQCCFMSSSVICLWSNQPKSQGTWKERRAILQTTSRCNTPNYGNFTGTSLFPAFLFLSLPGQRACTGLHTFGFAPWGSRRPPSESEPKSAEHVLPGAPHMQPPRAASEPPVKGGATCKEVTVCSNNTWHTCITRRAAGSSCHALAV